MTSRRIGDHCGNVVVEFIGLVVAVVVPISGAAAALWPVTATRLEVSGLVHAASRAYATAASDGQGLSRVRALLASSGTLSGTRIDVRCQSSPCITSGSLVTITLTRMTHVSAPLVGTRDVQISVSDSAMVDAWR